MFSIKPFSCAAIRARLTTPLFFVELKKILIFIFAIQASSYAEAEDNSTQITLSPSLLYFDYTEFNTSDQVLDREIGWLPGITSELTYTSMSGWVLGGDFSYFTGVVSYTGQTQGGSSHNTQTETELIRLGASIKRKISQNNAIFARFTSHGWERNILDNNNVFGIDETYQWHEYVFGANHTVHLQSSHQLTIEASYLLTKNATIDVDLSRAGFGSTTLDIADGTGGRIKLAWLKPAKDNLQLGASIFFEAWDFGRSNSKQTRGGSSTAYITEPRSETRNLGISFDIKHQF